MSRRISKELENLAVEALRRALEDPEYQAYYVLPGYPEPTIHSRKEIVELGCPDVLAEAWPDGGINYYATHIYPF